MNIDKKVMTLYAVTDRSWLNGRELIDDVKLALEGGITCLQLREKNLSKDDFLEEAKKICKLCHEYNVPFIINDDVDIAVKCGADGVHVGQKDMDVAIARKMLGRDKIIGVSARTVDQALEAQKKGADYLGVGAAFTTSTKGDAKHVDGEVMKAICDAVDIPVCAIGGIDADNILSLEGRGIDGVAVVSAIFAQKDIYAATTKLLGLSKEISRR